MRILLLSIATALLLTQPAIAKNTLPIIEVFTDSMNMPRCGEVDTTLEEVFEDLIKENPNSIALNYQRIYSQSQEPLDKDEKLNTFIFDRNFLYYKQRDSMNPYATFRMVIGGAYKTSGRMKHIADAAIKRYESERSIPYTKLAIKGQNIEIELPKINTYKDLRVNLIGYKKNSKEGQNIVTSFKELKPWNGQSQQQTISIKEMEADGFALLAQDSRTAEIYAAGKVER